MARIQKGPSIAVLAIGILQLLVGLSLTITAAVFASKLDGAGAPYWASIPVSSFIALRSVFRTQSKIYDGTFLSK